MKPDVKIPEDYGTRVYAGLLGKVIGVYMGRPVEGLTNEEIEKRWGKVDRYLNDGTTSPVVVPDDDISGTVAFVRILGDSGFYEHTPQELYGENWLNCMIEGQSILWWGGMGISTEHTAFLRLKNGYKAPVSGCADLNTKEVSEQIGAQIFIDAFGMVAPGRPALAAALAEKSARVSHDGEAVNAARVVAAMIAMAFDGGSVDSLLDKAVMYIPENSVIAQVHEDVREWSAQADGDWKQVFGRIREKYGYDKWGGGCHVVPNHAVMVMAWACGGGDFRKSLEIACTAGWDTDCNAGNVGSVLGVLNSLEGIDSSPYDFRAPFADRVLIPSADGCDCVTDVLRLAEYVEAIGRKICASPDAAEKKDGAMHHFEQPGAMHGYMAFGPSASVRNICAPGWLSGERCLELSYRGENGAVNGVETPVGAGDGAERSAYRCACVPLVHPCLSAKAALSAAEGSCRVRMFLRLDSGDKIESQWMDIDAKTYETRSWEIPVYTGSAAAFGFETAPGTSGKLLIDSVDFVGNAYVSAGEDNRLTADGPKNVRGWISSLDRIIPEAIHRGRSVTVIGSDETPGVLVTGSRRWRTQSVECDMFIHAADRAGIILNYQGLRRHILVCITHDRISVIRNKYGEKILAEIPFAPGDNEFHKYLAVNSGGRISISVDGVEMLSVGNDTFYGGGAGIMVERGKTGFSSLVIKATV